jgi:hypothetical protein
MILRRTLTVLMINVTGKVKTRKKRFNGGITVNKRDET